MRKIVSFLCCMVAAIGVTALVPVSSGSVALAQSINVIADSAAKSAACQGIGLTGSDTCVNNGIQLSGTISGVVNILSAIVGLAATIMIIIAGLKFVTASGDSNSVAGAKRTLIYALIGLVVAGSAVTIVHFFLAKAVG